jgi:ppGpp synthetase/RelA/SpoT-type nucleotidyltranferase
MTLGMQKWTEPAFSKSEADRAGEALFRKKSIADHDYMVFANFRDAHNYPLHVIKKRLQMMAKRIEDGNLVSQRIKRISSIQKKMIKMPTMRLSYMQDIGGCRAVMKNVRNAEHLARIFQGRSGRSRHVLAHQDNYIEHPRETGYRGIHLIYRFVGNIEEKICYNGFKNEIQIRSRLQHAWATAVETVGTFTGQALKSSEGQEEWLRFFVLMSAAIARKENCPVPPETPMGNAALKRELRQYASKLKVESTLSTFGQAVNQVHTTVRTNRRIYYHLLELNPATKEVRIKGFRKDDLESAQNEYLKLERNLPAGNDAVLVALNDLTALPRAYPNYFLDTHLFIEEVKDAIA